jgi:hypothetical protein
MSAAKPTRPAPNPKKAGTFRPLAAPVPLAGAALPVAEPEAPAPVAVPRMVVNPVGVTNPVDVTTRVCPEETVV